MHNTKEGSMERIEELIERTIKMEHALQKVAEMQAYRNDRDNQAMILMQENINKLNMVILGSGMDAGMAERLRVLENKEKNWGKQVWALWLTILSIISGLVIKYFSR
jgi:hypothetical protein